MGGVKINNSPNNMQSYELLFFWYFSLRFGLVAVDWLDHLSIHVLLDNHFGLVNFMVTL